MRLLKAIIVVFLFSPLGFTQAGTTAVTALVKDANSNPYVNCQWSVVFVGENTTPGAGPYAPAALLNGQQGNCDSFGNLTVNLADNINTVTPTPSQWSFSICSAAGYLAGPYCQTNILITITGSTQNISTILSAVLPLLPTSPTNLPSASTFGQVPVSTAAGTLHYVAQTKPAIDVRDYGVKGDGSTDDTTAMQNAINAACPSATHFSGKLLGGPAPFIVKLTSTLSISKCWGLTIDFGASQGQATPAAAGNSGFLWAGSSGGTVLSISQTRDSEFKNFFIDCVNCNIPLLVDEIGSVTTITTNNHFENIAVRNDASNSNFIGVDICPAAPGDCESQNFDRLTVTCSTTTATASNNGIGILYSGAGGAEAYYEYLHWYESSTCSRAIDVEGVVDILDIDGGLANANYTDLFLNHGRNINYRHIRSETGTAQIVIGTAASSPAHDLTVEEAAFAGLTNSTTTISFPFTGTGGTIRLIKNDWDANSTVIPFGPSGSGTFVGNLVSSQNTYPSTSTCPLTEMGTAAWYSLQDSGCSNDTLIVGSSFPNVAAIQTSTIVLGPSTFANLPSSPSNGTLIYCSDCKNAQDDSVAFDSTATNSGHGTNVLRENGSWRVH